MPRREHQQPQQPPRGKALLLTPGRAAKLMALLDRLDLEPDPTQFQKYTRAGQVFFRLRDTPGENSPGGGGGGAPFYATITTIPDSDPAEYQVTVSPGYLDYRNAGAIDFPLGPCGYLVPTIGGISMEDTENVEPLPLPALASYLYLRVKTDADGVPKPAEGEGGGYQVTVEIFDAPQTSTHHVRPSPSGGEEEGDYFILLAQTESDGGTPAAPRIVRRITGNREMVNQLVEIANTAEDGARELYKGYLPGPDDKHEIRGLRQLVDGDDYQIPILQPLPEGEDEGDSIPILGLGVEITSPARPARFELGADNKVGLLDFFGLDGDVDLSAGGTIAFAGGLAVSFTGGAGPGGWWGDVTIDHTPAVGSTQYVTLRFEAGSLKKVFLLSGEVSGTEGTPGVATLSTTDT